MGVASAIIGGAAAITGGLIAARGARQAAETQAQAQQAAIDAQTRAAQEAQAERERAAQLQLAALESPELQELGTTLRERIAGRGLIDVSAATAPVAEQIRAGLREQTIPGIAAAASARGLGRSTIPIAQISQASQAAERDIATRIQNLEIARQGQIERAIDRFQQLGEFKVRGEQVAASTIADSANRFANDQFAIANSIASKGATEAAGELLSAQMISSGIIGMGLSAQQATQRSTEDIISAIENEQGARTGALVNIADTSGRVGRSAAFLNPELNIGGF